MKTRKLWHKVSLWGALVLAVLAMLLIGPARMAAAQSPATPESSAWIGEYYGNRTLSGAPALVRDDGAIDFDWGYGSPAYGIPAEGFSARWTRSIYLAGGTYRLYALSDDGVRVWLDNQLIIDQWHPSPGNVYAVDRALSAGTHLFRIEYYEEAGGAKIRFWWEAAGGQNYPDWKGEYYANGSLDGGPALVRNDKKIDFDWARGSPAAGIPGDGFSVRWTRRVEFQGGTYRFHAVVDGAVSLWVDGRLLIDAWHDGRSREFRADYRLGGGQHDIKVEFFEGSGDAEIRVWWDKVYVPYYPEPGYPDWKGQYWANQYMGGNPKLVRNDKEIDFDWGTAAAGPGLPADKFSVRWDARVNFAAGTYTFYARADNGIRVYLDGELIVDEWYTNSERLHAVTRRLSGSHHLAVEFYENGGPAMVEFWWE